MQVADEAVPRAQEFNQEQLQPAAEYIAKNFEQEAKRLADEVGPLAEGCMHCIVAVLNGKCFR